jgi:hypothetical protein
MGVKTLLQLVNAAERELGLAASPALAGQTMGQACQMFNIANECGEEMLDEHTWGDLHTVGMVTSQVGIATYPLPADYSRMLSETHWDSSTRWPIRGPISPQLYNLLIRGPYMWPSNRVLFRQVGSSAMTMYPTPTANGIVYDFEYVRKTWALSSGGAPQTDFQADTDTCVFHSRMMISLIKWNYAAAKGLGTAAALKVKSDDLVQKAIARDLGGKHIDMGGEGVGDTWGAIGSATPGNVLFWTGE